jgi:hypothetical protein
MTELEDKEYVLVDGACWLELKGFSIRVNSTDEGVVVDVYEKGKEDQDCIASTYAFDSELESQDEELDVS